MTWTLAIAAAALIISTINSILLYRRDQRESKNFEKQNAMKLSYWISKGRYFEDKNFDQFTGKPYYYASLSIDYLISNKSQISLNFDRVFLVFRNCKTGKHITNVSHDFTKTNLNIKAGETTKSTFKIEFTKEDSISKIVDCTINIRAEINGYPDPFFSEIQTLEFEQEN